MSQQVINKGKLVFVTNDPHEYVKKHTNEESLCDFLDEHFEDFSLINDVLYYIDWCIQEGRSHSNMDFLDVTQNEDRSIDFHVSYSSTTPHWTWERMIEDYLNS